ncbi:MAG: phosphotransferase, partial [Aquabacterium sp.]
AGIHGLPTDALPPLRRAGPAQELQNLRDWHRGHGTARPVFQLAMAWLQARLPAEPPALALVHGDFRNGNLIVAPQGLAAVLDWELAHVGDPAEDLGWLCVASWRFGRTALTVGGFGQVDDLAAGYADGGGVFDAARVHWWQVLGTLRWGVICESMVHAWLHGEADNLERAAVGRRASEAEADLLALIAPRTAAAA